MDSYTLFCCLNDVRFSCRDARFSCFDFGMLIVDDDTMVKRSNAAVVVVNDIRTEYAGSQPVIQVQGVWGSTLFAVLCALDVT